MVLTRAVDAKRAQAAPTRLRRGAGLLTGVAFGLSGAVPALIAARSLTAFIGAPVLIWWVRRAKVGSR